MPSASNINDLDCQTSLMAHVDPQRLFPALSTLIVERDDGRHQAGLRDDAAGPFETRRLAEAVALRPAPQSQGIFRRATPGWFRS